MSVWEKKVLIRRHRAITVEERECLRYERKKNGERLRARTCERECGEQPVRRCRPSDFVVGAECFHVKTETETEIIIMKVSFNKPLR